MAESWKLGKFFIGKEYVEKEQKFGVEKGEEEIGAFGRIKEKEML